MYDKSLAQQSEGFFYGEIRDTIRPVDHGPIDISRLRLEQIEGITSSAVAMDNSALYLIPKYERGRYVYIPERGILYTDAGSYYFSTKFSVSNTYTLDSKRIRLFNSAQSQLIFRQDSTFLFKSASERLYLPLFNQSVHHYYVTLKRQVVERPSLISFADNLSYSSVLWAGLAGIQTLSILQFNSYEYFRVNIPLIINQDNFRFQQDIGYGYNDRRWKFGSQVTTSLNKWKLTVSIRRDIEEANNYFFNQPISDEERTRLFFLSRYDRISEGTISAYDPRTQLQGQVGIIKRQFFMADSLSITGGFVRLSYEKIFRGAYVDYSNGYQEKIHSPHYIRLSTYSFIGRGQHYTLVRPIYFFSNSSTAAIQIHMIAEGIFALGKLSERLYPTFAGNGIDFNTMADACMETLTPTALAVKQAIGLHFLLQKKISLSTDFPYQPSFFLAANAAQVIEAVNLYQREHPILINQAFLKEIGFGIRNLFVFPVPILRPAIGVGYFYGFYSSELKDLNSGSFKFTIRFFN